MAARHLSQVFFMRVRDKEEVRKIIMNYLIQLVKHEDPVSIDYPYPHDLNRWLRDQKDNIFYFFMSGNLPSASAFVVPPVFKRKVFNYNEKGKPEFKIINYPELTGVFVQPEFRGRGIVGKFISLALEDYEEIIILPKAKDEVERAGIELLSSIVGVPFDELRKIINWCNDPSIVEPLILCDVPSDKICKIRDIVGKVNETSIPMEIASRNRGTFIGYSFPWLGPVYLLTREQQRKLLK